MVLYDFYIPELGFVYQTQVDNDNQTYEYDYWEKTLLTQDYPVRNENWFLYFCTSPDESQTQNLLDLFYELVYANATLGQNALILQYGTYEHKAASAPHVSELNTQDLRRQIMLFSALVKATNCSTWYILDITGTYIKNSISQFMTNHRDLENKVIAVFPLKGFYPSYQERFILALNGQLGANTNSLKTFMRQAHPELLAAQGVEDAAYNFVIMDNMTNALLLKLSSPYPIELVSVRDVFDRADEFYRWQTQEFRVPKLPAKTRTQSR